MKLARRWFSVSLALFVAALAVGGLYLYLLATQDSKALAQRWADAGYSLLRLASEADGQPLSMERLLYLRSTYLNILDLRPGLAVTDWRLLKDAQAEADRIGRGTHRELGVIDSATLEMRAGLFFRRAADLDPGGYAAESGLRRTVGLLLKRAHRFEAAEQDYAAAHFYRFVLQIDPSNGDVPPVVAR